MWITSFQIHLGTRGFQGLTALDKWLFFYILKVPYYTVFHQFHTAVRGPTTLYLKCIAPSPSVVHNFSCLKVNQVSSTESRLFLCLHLQMLMISVCQCLSCLLHAPLRERALALAVACANVYGGCIAMARRDAVIQPYQFDPESDPEGETPEEVQTLWLQQGLLSELLVCLTNVSLFNVLLQLLLL